MNKYLTGGFATLLAASTILSGVPAAAQGRGHDRDGRPGQSDWNNNNHDRGDRNDQRDRADNRGMNNGRDNRRLQYWGGNHGYQGYAGQWRAGQRYPHYRDRGDYISDYNAYGLPAPRRGYRYYRSDNGDIVMAAVASGMIGLIIGGALAH